MDQKTKHQSSSWAKLQMTSVNVDLLSSVTECDNKVSFTTEVLLGVLKYLLYLNHNFSTTCVGLTMSWYYNHLLQLVSLFATERKKKKLNLPVVLTLTAIFPPRRGI